MQPQQVVVVVLALVACLFAGSLAQRRPNLPETFEMHAYISVNNNGSLLFGEGWWNVDQPGNRAVENYVFGGFSHLNVYSLQRFDLAKDFSIIDHKCTSKPLKGHMPPVWNWLPLATFDRNITSEGVNYEVWSATIAGVRLEVATPANRHNELAYFGRFTSHSEWSIYVETWKTERPHDSWFEVPRECTVAANKVNLISA